MENYVLCNRAVVCAAGKTGTSFFFVWQEIGITRNIQAQKQAKVYRKKKYESDSAQRVRISQHFEMIYIIRVELP